MTADERMGDVLLDEAGLTRAEPLTQRLQALLAPVSYTHLTLPTTSRV